MTNSSSKRGVRTVLVCNVLGAIEVQVDGATLELGGPVPRRLFTALVAAEGKPVSDDRLIEMGWGADAPAQAVSALRVCISRLRQALGSRARALLERHRTGYVLRLGRESTDVARFSAAVERARALVTQGEAGSAARALTEALALWRGEPFADLGDSNAVRPARARLLELRESAVDERSAAWLAQGDAARAVAELGAAVAASPYRERRWELLSLGLYRCGRQGDALATLRTVRALLADELGVDPGPRLQELEQRILGQDPLLMLTGPDQSPDGTDQPAPLGGTEQPAQPSRSARARGRRLSTFLGRERELTTIETALRGERLVTLVGPAGVGKTRLMVEYLAMQPDGDGPWLVRLADVSRPEVLAQAVADAMELAETAGEPLATLRRALAVRPGLLVLDNCEHLVDSVAELALELLGGCPGLRVLATSREPLTVDGEMCLPIEPLSLRDRDGSDGPAVALLLDRVAAVRTGWVASAEERTHARQICTALDGLPLALELAAARARTLALGEIAERLDDRFALLGAIPRGSLTVHATLRAAIEWSVEQLPDADRALLFRLWPFEGGFTLDAAEAVRPAETSMLESVSTLVARSVVIADTSMTPTRYRLLETLRAYCREHDPDPAASREAHARWCRELVARCAPELDRPRTGHVPRMLRRELPNLRAGIAHDLVHDPEAALGTVGPLDRFWINGGHLDEGRRLIDAALRAAPHASALDRGRGYLARASLSALTEDIAQAGGQYAEAIRLANTSTDREHRVFYGRIMFRLALGSIIFKLADAAKGAAEEALVVGRETGDDWIIASGQAMLGAALVMQKRETEGEALLTEAARLASDSQILWTAGCAELFLGWAVLRRAAASTDADGAAREAIDILYRAVQRFEQLEDVTFSLTTLDTASMALAIAGQPADGVRLRAAVHRHCARLGIPADYLRRLQAIVDDLPAIPVLDPAELAEAAAQGADLTWSRMVALLAAHSTGSITEELAQRV